MYKGIKTTLAEFDTDLAQLKVDELLGKRIEQSHFGDALMIFEESPSHERYRVWLSLEENVEQGQARVQIEYAGRHNDYSWEVVAEINE